MQTFKVETEGVFLNARVLLVQEKRGGSSSHGYYSATDILIIRFNLTVMFDKMSKTLHMQTEQFLYFLFSKMEKVLHYHE